MTTLPRSPRRSAPRPGRPPYDPETVSALDGATGAVHRLAGIVHLLPVADRVATAGMRSAAVATGALAGCSASVFDLLRYEAGDLERPDDPRREPAQRAAAAAAALRATTGRVGLGEPIDADVLGALRDGTGGDDDAGTAAAGRAGSARLSRVVQDLADPTDPPLVRLAMAHWRLGAPSARGAPERRIGPLLPALGLAAWGILGPPVLRLPGRFAAHPERYRALLTAADPAPWVRWFLEAVRTQAIDDARWAVRLRQVELATAHRLRQRRASGTAVAAAGTLLARPFLSAHTLAGDLGVTLPTARAAIAQLVASGDLVETTRRRRSRRYLATGMLAEVYGERDPFAGLGYPAG